jgi:hypothetical protein
MLYRFVRFSSPAETIPICLSPRPPNWRTAGAPTFVDAGFAGHINVSSGHGEGFKASFY